MIQVTPQMRVLVAIEPEDFRKGIDGLCRVAKERLGDDPFSGAVFVFRNRRATAVKILIYNGRGFWLCQMRLSSGRLGWWPSGAHAAATALEAHELQVLLCGGDPDATKAAPVWRSVQQ